MSFLTQKRIEDLQKIMLEDYNYEMSYSEAELMAKDVVGVFDLMETAAKREGAKAP